MLMMGFGYVSHRAIGVLLHYFWDGDKNMQGSPVYSIENFRDALLVLPISLIVAIIGFVLLAIIEKSNKKIAK